MDSRCWGGGGNLDKIQRTAEFFGKPSLTYSIYVQSTTLTWHQGWYFAKQQNGSTNRHRDRVGANLFYWQTGCGSNRKLYSVEILNRQCQSWWVVEAAPTMEGICYAAISSNPCHHWWNCGDFLRLSFGHSLVEKIVLSRKLTFKGICWRGLMKRSLDLLSFL